MSRWHPLFVLTVPPVPPEEAERIREAMADMGWLPEVTPMAVEPREPRPFRAHTSLGTLGPLRLGAPLPQFQPGAYRSLALWSLYRQWATYDWFSHTSRTN